MVILAVFIIILGLGVILAFWSMREYGPGGGEGRVEAPQAEKRGKEVEESKRKRVSLKGEILLSPKKKRV